MIIITANGSLTAPGSSAAAPAPSSSSSTEMQHDTSTNGGDEKLDHNGKVAGYANGGGVGRCAPLFLDKTDREIVRLIGQHLKIIGLE